MSSALRQHFLTSTSIRAGAQVWRANAPREKQKPMIRRRGDGTLEFLNGSPVTAKELIPGQEYTVLITGDDQ